MFLFGLLRLAKVDIILLPRSHKGRNANARQLLWNTEISSGEDPVEVGAHGSIFTKRQYLGWPLVLDSGVARCDDLTSSAYGRFDWLVVNLRVVLSHNESVCGIKEGCKAWVCRVIGLEVEECLASRD